MNNNNTSTTSTTETYKQKLDALRKAMYVALAPADRLFVDFLDVPIGGEGWREMTEEEREAYDLLNKIEEAFCNFEDLLASDKEKKAWTR
jgi:hypothetical protein